MREWRRPAVCFHCVCLMLLVGMSYAQEPAAAAKRIAIRAGRLIDGKSDTPVPNALI